MSINASGAVPLESHPTSFCCAPPDTGVSDLQLVALERLPSIEGSAEILIGATFLRGSITSPPHFVRHLPLTRGGLWGAHSKAPLVKGSWRGAPEGLARRSGLASPMRGSCRRRRLMRWTASHRYSCLHLIRHGFAVPPSPHIGRHLVPANTEKLPAKRCRPANPVCTFY